MSATAAPVFDPRPGTTGASAPARTIALAGCGVVGGAFAELLGGSIDGSRLEITRVLIRAVDRVRPQLSSRELLTDDIPTFLAADADIVVEATGCVQAGRRIALATLRRGATFVTANKALVAAAGGELARVARTHGGTLRFDAAVGGGVPVLRTLASSLGGRPPSLVRGILNGTSNFVLSAIERGATLDAALAEARARGFAEADASRDLDGRDAAEKLALVAWVAYGVEPEAAIVRRHGVLPDVERLVCLAAAVGGRLRLVAECALADGSELVSSVEPTVVGARSALGLTTGEENRVEVHSGWGAPLTIAGPGAGGVPTATALLSDVHADASTVPARRGTVRSVPDRRALTWALGASVAPQLLEHLLLTCGLDVLTLGSWDAGRSGGASASFAVIGACRRDAVERVVPLLPPDARPVVARVDASLVDGVDR